MFLSVTGFRVRVGFFDWPLSVIHCSKTCERYWTSQQGIQHQYMCNFFVNTIVSNISHIYVALRYFFFLDLTLEIIRKFIDCKTSPHIELSNTLTKDSVNTKAKVHMTPEEPQRLPFAQMLPVVDTSRVYLFSSCVHFFLHICKFLLNEYISIQNLNSQTSPTSLLSTCHIQERTLIQYCSPICSAYSNFSSLDQENKGSCHVNIRIRMWIISCLAVVLTFNPSIWEAELSRPLSLGSAWSTE